MTETAPAVPAAPPALEQLATEADLLDLTDAGAAAATLDSAVPAAKQKVEIPTGDFLAGMLQPAFDNLAPNWKLKRQEVVMLAHGWAAVLDHYFPGGVGAWGPWGAALGVTVTVLGPRISTPPMLPESPAAGQEADKVSAPVQP